MVPIYTLTTIVELFPLGLADKLCYQVFGFLPKLPYFSFILWFSRKLLVSYITLALCTVSYKYFFHFVHYVLSLPLEIFFSCKQVFYFYEVKYLSFHSLCVLSLVKKAFPHLKLLQNFAIFFSSVFIKVLFHVLHLTL